MTAITNNIFTYRDGLGETFNIEGLDGKGKVILDEINRLYDNVQQDANEDIYLNKYLAKDEVLIAYLGGIIKNKYADQNIAAAHLHLQGKQLAAFHDYSLPTGKLFADFDHKSIDVTNQKTVCVVFHPNSNQISAHYSTLTLFNRNECSPACAI